MQVIYCINRTIVEVKTFQSETLSVILGYTNTLDLTYLSAGFGGHLKGGFESASLLSGQDGARPFGPPGILPVVPLPLASDAFLRLDVQLLVVAFLCGKSHLSVTSARV